MKKLLLLITLITLVSNANASEFVQSEADHQTEQLELCLDEIDLQYTIDGKLDGITREEYDEMGNECYAEMENK